MSEDFHCDEARMKPVITVLNAEGELICLPCEKLNRLAFASADGARERDAF